MSIEENKEAVKQYIERSGDFAAQDELLTNNYVFHFCGVNPPEEISKEQMNQRAANNPPPPLDSKVIEDMVAEGDIVSTRVIVSQKHTGKVLNVEPTGKTLTFYVFYFFRFEDGKIAEVWALNSQLSVFQQMGVLPPTPEIAKLKGA